MSDDLTRPTHQNFAEFFAGIGLVRCGLEKSGWKCVYANDNDEKKKEQYVAKFGDSHFHLCDVFDTESVVSRIPTPITLATASFPCVDLSLAGHWKGIGGSHSSAVFGFLQCIKSMGEVPFLLLENVVGLLSSNKGADFARLCEMLSDAGYWLDAFQLDARYFVPQSRPRVFIVGIHKSIIDATPFVRSTEEFTLGDSWRNQISKCTNLRPKRLRELMCSTNLETGWFSSTIKEPPVLREELAEFIDVDDDQEWWEEENVIKHVEMMADSHREQVETARKSVKLTVGTIYRRKRNGATRSEVRLDGIAGCLRTPKGGSARQIVIVVKDNEIKMRWMSPIEYARLQGARDFPLVGKVNQQLFGFGDAVCVPVIEWIDKQIFSPAYQMLNAFKATATTS